MSANDKAAATYGPGRTTPPLEARVRLEVGRVVANVRNWPRPISAHLLGHDLSDPIDLITAALLPVIEQVRADAKREARSEWADHIETWEATVGAQVCNPANIVAALRSPHTPFGCSEQP